jgi:DNA-binding MarR family transcriptional regulator
MPDPSPAATLLFLREEELRQGIELLYFAGRDFGGAADPVLREHGLDRMHHRIIHFVSGQPLITVSDLADLLGITKQSLGRALLPLLAAGFVLQKPGANDRRQRLLSLTEKGQTLERQLSDRFRARMARAYRDAGPQAVEGFRKVMVGLIDAEDRQRFERPGASP